MKKIFAVALMGMSLNAHALTDKHERFCQAVAKVGKVVMSKRQQGVDVTKLMDLVKTETDPALKEVIQQVIIAAYDRPRYNTTTFREQAVSDYKNEVYIECVKNF